MDKFLTTMLILRQLVPFAGLRVFSFLIKYMYKPHQAMQGF